MLNEELVTRLIIIENLKNQVENERSELVRKREEMMVIKKESEAENVKAKAILDECKQAVQNIDRKSLQNIKSYIKPTPLIALVISSVCLLFGYEESWASAKKHLLMDATKFLERLQEFDVNGKNKRFQKLRKKYFSDEDFNYPTIFQQSESCADIYNWVVTIEKYFQLNKSKLYKEKKLESITQDIQKQNKELSSKEQTLFIYEEKSKSTLASYKQSNIDRKKAEDSMDDLVK